VRGGGADQRSRPRDRHEWRIARMIITIVMMITVLYVIVPSRTLSAPGVVPAVGCAVPHLKTHPAVDYDLNVHSVNGLLVLLTQTMHLLFAKTVKNKILLQILHINHTVIGHWAQLLLGWVTAHSR